MRNISVVRLREANEGKPGLGINSGYPSLGSNDSREALGRAEILVKEVAAAKIIVSKSISILVFFMSILLANSRRLCPMKEDENSCPFVRTR